MNEGKMRPGGNASCDGADVVIDVIVFDGFWARARGLIGRPCPNPNQGVWILPCNRVHSLFMAYTIDVVHLDSTQNVVGLERLRPFRLGRRWESTESVVELKAGETDRLKIRPGKKIGLHVRSLS